MPAPGDTKRYNRLKLGIGITSSLVSFLFIVFVTAGGISRTIAAFSLNLTGSSIGSLLLFTAILGLANSILTFPFGFVSSFILEHRFGLSNQTILRWITERLKGLAIGVPLAVVVILFLWYCLTEWGQYWWLPLGIGLTALSTLLARLAPVVILPLFYKLSPLEDGPVRKRILDLCARFNVKIDGIFRFDLSKNTKKANAAFTGIGKAKRIILGDTLVESFTDEEIETVFAHELGHLRHKHILIGMVVGTISTFIGLFVTAVLYQKSLALFGFTGLTDLAALPLLAVWLSLYGLVTGPIGNALSRRHERQADAFAVTSTSNPGAFVSALKRLAEQNIADPDPHPLVEFLFYSHPSISKRIRFVESMAR
jgi:STE24 endopeptidase